MFNQLSNSHTAFGKHQSRLVVCVAATFVVSSLSACGQKGPLKDPSLDEPGQNQATTFDSVSLNNHVHDIGVSDRTPRPKRSAS